VLIRRSNPKRNYTKIPDAALRDERLSYRARGVLAELLSRPDDWDTNADAISRRAKRERAERGEGREALRNVFTELETYGYIRRRRRQSERGTWVTETTVYDTRQPATDRDTDNRASVNQTSDVWAFIHTTEYEEPTTDSSTTAVAGSTDVHRDSEFTFGTSTASRAAAPPATTAAHVPRQPGPRQPWAQLQRRHDEGSVDACEVLDDLLDLDSGEISTVNGMLANGSHPKTVYNTILKHRDF
jgi:hypothetical protein